MTCFYLIFVICLHVLTQYLVIVCQEDGNFQTTPSESDDINEVTVKNTKNDNDEVYGSVEILQIFLPPGIGNAVHLVWGWRFDDFVKNATYNIYYGTENEQLNSPKLQTQNLSAILENLEFCTKYTFAVTTKNNTKINPNDLRTVMTYINPELPPENLKLNYRPTETPCLVITWSSSCANVGRPVGYLISILERSTSINKIITTPSTKKSDLIHYLKVNYGDEYDVKISTNFPGSKASETVTYAVPSFLQPYNLKVTANQKDGAFMVYWSEPYVPSYVGRVYYEVGVYRGANLTEKHSEKYYVIRPVLIYKGDDQQYTFRVRLVSYDGEYRSILTKPVVADLYGGVNELEDYDDS